MAPGHGRRRVYGLELAGEDDAFAAREAACAATGVEVVAPGLATARGVDADRLRSLAYTHRASHLLGHAAASVADARALVEAATMDRTGSVAVRARDVRGTAGVDTRRAERALGSALVDRGFTVDLDTPDHELRACFAGDTCLVGWLVSESVRDYGDRRPTDRPFFQPGSMAPLDARALVNLAGVDPGDRLLDPMCGTGGVLIEAGLVGARPVGIDAQRKMVRGARENCRAYLDTEPSIVRGDATRLPLGDDAVSAVVFDAPYGRQSKIERHTLADLVGGALTAARRVAPRAVVVGDRSWSEAARAAGWTVEATFERRVHGSLVRHVHLLR
ncbi:methyltransferase domain-containing protein [Haloplanus rallus]|uniref:tRNA (guanine(10)-N(2))-dimethyltransferase n=1 Tax=Haloplanus rallus TaxID=1816183 RepID=A0A6B9FH26_9EURY|nr:methyltransferase domain-containing protein [Haloplanus rallus]QGX95783.1 methyltransferase domain-containing protein [Haloplanus rallus]